MKKFTVLAMVAAVLMAGAAFARSDHRLTIQPNATFTFGGAGAVSGSASGPTTTNNDDSCDIGTAPAATLLLPFFDVDFKSPQTTARTTLFTITNVSFLPQIAHVVIWTDWSFPALDFNIFLTGYDVQAINLYDIFARGVIAPPSGTSSLIAGPTQIAGTDSTPALNTGNPLLNLSACGTLPGPIPPALLADLQAIFTAGIGSGTGIPCAVRVGGPHNDAIGYITVDVNANCNTSLPNDPGATYFTTNILFDNVLIGDYENVQPNPAVVNAAGGSPMVSIRAVPEGGVAGTVTPGTNLPFTFYDRYTVGAPGGERGWDRRQPLPNTFAARYIQGGTGSFNTNFQIWREGFTIGGCSTGASGAINNSSMAVTEIVRFDEHENSTSIVGAIPISPTPPLQGLPETSSTAVSSGFFPALPSAAGDVGGWIYLNLNNRGVFGNPPVNATFSRLTAVGVRTPFNGTTVNSTNRPSQNWVTINLQAESRFSVLFDAAWLGNGCSPGVAAGTQIGPAGGVLVCPQPFVPGTNCALTPVGTNVNPF